MLVKTTSDLVSSIEKMSSVDSTEPGFRRELAAASPRGVSEAEFRCIYERHAAEILRYAIRCVGRREIAEEIASEAFLRMHQNRDGLDGSHAAAWLTTTVKNLATDHWRRAGVERRHLNTISPEEAATAPPGDWEELLRNPALKPEHRICLTLHFVHGMDRKEISSHTGLADNPVKNCLQYGLRLLRKSHEAGNGGR